MGKFLAYETFQEKKNATYFCIEFHAFTIFLNAEKTLANVVAYTSVGVRIRVPKEGFSRSNVKQISYQLPVTFISFYDLINYCSKK